MGEDGKMNPEKGVERHKAWVLAREGYDGIPKRELKGSESWRLLYQSPEESRKGS